MDAKQNGKMSACPVDVRWFDIDKQCYDKRLEGGLTKREVLAMAAMQGMLAWNGPDSSELTKEELAIGAVQNADALLAELAKERP